MYFPTNLVCGPKKLPSTCYILRLRHKLIVWTNLVYPFTLLPVTYFPTNLVYPFTFRLPVTYFPTPACYTLSDATSIPFYSTCYILSPNQIYLYSVQYTLLLYEFLKPFTLRVTVIKVESRISINMQLENVSTTVRQISTFCLRIFLYRLFQISGVELTVTYSPHIQVNFLWPNPESIVNGYLQYLPKFLYNLVCCLVLAQHQQIFLYPCRGYIYTLAEGIWFQSEICNFIYDTNHTN